jgi:histone chaperone ASF1
MNLSECINILGVRINENPFKIRDNLNFQILFELKKELKERLEVKFVYIESPENEKKDQDLEIYEIPSNRIGKFKVDFCVKPPTIDPKKCFNSFGMTLILIQFKIRNLEIIRIGYYMNTEFHGPVEKDSNSNLFLKTCFTERNVLENEPRLTKFFCL